MLTAFLLASSMVGFQTPPANPITTTVFERGGTGDASFRYWAVADTFLDNTRTDQNFGRDGLLSSGPGKPILIRFGDLNRMIPAGATVRAARLLLTQEIGDTPQLARAARLLRPWGEGPSRRGIGLLAIPLEPGAKSPNLSASWNSPLGGLRQVEWQASGARGAADAAPIAEANGVQAERLFVVDGLGSAVQRMLDQPWSNHGLVLDFQNVVDFRSSDAAAGRPRLVVEWSAPPTPREADLSVTQVNSSLDRRNDWPKLGESVSWTATVQYRGSAPSGPLRVIWEGAGAEPTVQSFDQGLAPGATLVSTFSQQWGTASGDPRTRPIRVRVEGSIADADPANDFMAFHEASLPVFARIAQGESRGIVGDAVRFLNESALPQSRFSFALDGARASLRLAEVTVQESANVETSDLRTAARDLLLQAGLMDLRRTQILRSAQAGRASVDANPGLLGGGDTRNDEAYPGILGFPNEPWFDAASQELNFPATDLLAATDVVSLHAFTLNRAAALEQFTPRTTVLRVLDGSGELIRNARLEAYALFEGAFSAIPLFTIENTGGGIANLPNVGRTPFPNFLGGVLRIDVIKDGRKASGFLKCWQLLDAFARGNPDAGIIPLQVPLPSDVPGTTNLAPQRFVTDKAGSSPLTLERLIDENPATALAWPVGDDGWVEIDLQKDRQLTRIELVLGSTAIWDRFDVQVWNTGQSVAAARSWYREVNGPWKLANLGDDKTLSLYGPVTRARYVRLRVPRSTPEVQLAEIRIFGTN